MYSTQEVTNSQNPTQTHNYGIDCLKIISMIMIATLHVLGQGGVLEHTGVFSLHYELAWALEVCCYCAVNCYALISGYVNYNTKFRYSKIASLYFQVVFYTIIITGLFLLWKPECINWKIIIRAIFPFGFNDMYWYYTAYFCMFFFVPFFNRCIAEWDRQTCKRLIFSLILVFSVLPTIFMTDLAVTAGGYSVLWLSVLYLIGAYIRKYQLETTLHPIVSFLGYLGCAFLTWLAKLIAELVTKHFTGIPSHGEKFVNYTAPSVLFCGIFLVLCFTRLSFKKPMQSILRFFAPVSFGVYLLHVEPLVWEHIMKSAFAVFASYHPIKMCLAVLLAALCIWLLGSLVDWIRRLLFRYISRFFY